MQKYILNEETVTETKKKKHSHKPYTSKTVTTGDIDYNINMFNKRFNTTGYLNGTIDAGSPDGSNVCDSVSGDCGSAGEAGCCENLEEAKRYVRRYYVRPLNKFASNKAEIIKLLIDADENKQNCSVYTLNNLGDVKDVTKLTNKDIIYYYDDGILYDKNKVKVMDYDLFVKHEEQRDKVDPDKISDSAFKDVYDDRITDQTGLEEGYYQDHRYITTNGYKILNASDYAIDMPYIVARLVDDELWYYGAYDDETRAQEAAKACGNGTVIYAKDTKFVEGLTEMPADTEVLTEDSIYVGKLGATLELPPEIKLIDKTTIEEAVDKLEPEQEFEVGYINPVFLYKALWELMPIYKCTTFKGYTGVDFEGSEDALYSDKDKRIARARAEIERSKATGTTFEVGSDVNYTLQNKLVKQHTTVDPTSATPTVRNTILFYPEEVLDVVYYVKLPIADRFVKATAEELEDHIYRNLTKIQDKLRTSVEGAKAKIHTTLFSDELKAIEADRSTRSTADLETKYIYKHARDKHAVRALYTSQIYYFKTNDASYGKAITEELVEKENPFELTFEDVNVYGEELHESKVVEKECCICGEPLEGLGNNPEPYMPAASGKCCDACNLKFVIPARILDAASKD